MSSHFTLGDFDGDALADVAVATGYYQSAVSVILSRGTRFAEVSPAAPAGRAPTRMLAGDMDGDGLDDVVVIDSGGSAIIQRNRGNGVLSSRTAFALEQVISSAVMADIDGDLDIDIATLPFPDRSGKPTITLFENDGKASYTLRTVLEHDLEPRIIRLADVNADGQQDIIVEEERDTLTTGFSVLRNEGEWTFRLEHRGPAGAYVLDLAVADFDADGDMDVARLHYQAGELSVVLNQGGGRWGDPTVTPTVLRPTKLYVANADGDGFPHMFVFGSNEIRLHHGARGDRFKTPTSVPTAVSSAAFADIDADGDDDLIVGRAAACDSYCSRLEVFLNVAAGTLSLAGDHALEDRIHGLAPADLDSDGDADIVAAIFDEESETSHLRVITSSEEGLRHGRKITVASSGVMLEARDLDGDGDADVVPAGRAGFSVIRNDALPPVLRDADRDGVPDECERAPFRRGEADEDGALSLSDAVAILGVLLQGLPLPACPAALDADDSGRLDITDPVRILGHLFLGRGPLPEPFAACGPDPTPDALPCSQFGPCA
jgi:hypothetical protein